MSPERAGEGAVAIAPAVPVGASACDGCLRRTDVIAAVSGSIEVAWRERSGRTPRVLALPDE